MCAKPFASMNEEEEEKEVVQVLREERKNERNRKDWEGNMHESTSVCLTAYLLQKTEHRY